MPLQVGRGERLVVRIGKGEIIDVPPRRIVVGLFRLLWLRGVEHQDQAGCQQQKEQGIAELHHNKRPFQFEADGQQ